MAREPFLSRLPVGRYVCPLGVGNAPQSINALWCLLTFSGRKDDYEAQPRENYDTVLKNVNLDDGLGVYMASK